MVKMRHHAKIGGDRQYSYRVQDGGRPPSWIFKSSSF